MICNHLNTCPYIETTNCQYSSQFRCEVNGRCVYNKLRCDRQFDCENRLDEEECGEIVFQTKRASFENHLSGLWDWSKIRFQRDLRISRLHLILKCLIYHWIPRTHSKVVCCRISLFGNVVFDASECGTTTPRAVLFWEDTQEKRSVKPYQWVFKNSFEIWPNLFIYIFW